MTYLFDYQAAVFWFRSGQPSRIYPVRQSGMVQSSLFLALPSGLSGIHGSDYMAAKVIIPRSMIDPQRHAKALTNAIAAAGKAVKVDFKVTTRTWKTPVDFQVDAPSPYVRRIYTTNKIYIFVNFGTRPHWIRPRNKKVLAWSGGRRSPKTKPGAIKSNKGRQGRGVTVFARAVRHPGTKARDFDQVIVKKWQEEFPRILQRAIDSVL